MQHLEISSGIEMKKCDKADSPAAKSTDVSARIAFIAAAREKAVELALLHPKRLVSIDEVRAHCSLPEKMDPRVFGAVFSETKKWRKIGMAYSKRATCHHRPICVFELLEIAS